MIERLELHEGWTLCCLGGVDEIPADVRDATVPATVPGCVHTDLMAAGLIPDPYYDRNEAALQWIGRTDWRYATTFRVSAALLDHVRVELVCDGLDTVAEVRLNGSLVAETANQHESWRWDVRAALTEGANELAITFRSPVRYAEAMEARMGALPHTGPYAAPWNFIRKSACNFGWDWGPMLTTAGIWKPVGIEAWDGARIARVRPLARLADRSSTVLDVHVDVERASPGPVAITATLTGPGGETVTGNAELTGEETDALIALAIAHPKLWWPRGYGDQPLYDLAVDIGSDTWRRRTGLRHVQLDVTNDRIGTRFIVRVNDTEVFCKGANWIPDDCFVTRVDGLRLRARIGQATGANMNMLRVWGGGIYESDEFYDICDEQGVLVWQDFLFACAAYPEEAPFPESVEREARQNVARLSRHPSLVLWNGCNENIWGYFDWDWQKDIGERTWGKGYYLELLPQIIAETDPSRPYWPASPYSGSMDVHPNAAQSGNKHVWEAWYGENYDAYRKFAPRFCSEFGFQAPATYATIAQSMPQDQIAIGSDAMRAHQKSVPGDENNRRHLETHFHVPDEFDDWHFLLQLNQARALTLGVEWFRSRQPVCMGTLYWQLNDCWPVTSWAAVDGCQRRKPLWYATRRFYAERILTIQPEPDGALLVHAINDTDDTWEADVRLRRITFAGDEKAAQAAVLDVPPRSRLSLPVRADSVAAPDDPAGECIVAQTGDVRTFWYFDVDKNLDYPKPLHHWDIEKTSGGFQLTLATDRFLRDVCIFADRIDPDAEVSEQLVTLLPGENFEFRIATSRELSQDELSGMFVPPVFQCANRFGRA